jgi:hypothetical protein
LNDLVNQDLFMHNFDSRIFDNPGLHIVRLGTIQPHDGAYNLTVSEQPGGESRGYGLDHAHFDLLTSLDPATAGQMFSTGDRAFLLSLADDRALALILKTEGVSALDFVPKLRRPWALADEIDGRYIISFNGEDHFDLSQIGGRLLIGFASGSVRNIGTIALEVQHDLLTDPESLAIVRQAETEMRQSIEEILFDEVMVFVKALGDSGVATFEPAENRPKESQL